VPPGTRAHFVLSAFQRPPYATTRQRISPRAQQPAETPYWLDDNIMRAFGGIPPYITNVTRAQVIVKSLQSSLTTAYVMHELDQAVELLK
jgi:hypothetical protein